MVAADMQRPAAVQQLQQLGRQLDIPVYAEPAGNKPVDIAQRAVKWAREQAHHRAHPRHRWPPAH